MAAPEPLTDPVAVKFCNETVRPLADRLVGCLDLIDDVLVDWDPQSKGLGAVFGAADPATPIADGAPADGRTPIAAGHILALHQLCMNLKTIADATSDPFTQEPRSFTARQLLRKIAVSPR